MTLCRLGLEVAAVRRTAHVAWLSASIGLALLGCGSHTSPSLLPQRIAGQIPENYRMTAGRALALVRFSVHTNGVRGFGAIGNPLMVQFHDASLPGGAWAVDEPPQGLTLPGPEARVWSSGTDLPTLWSYAEPGLMAASFKPGTYDGMVIAYPDAQHEHLADSIPAPSRGMTFEPVELRAGTIVYLGHIRIEQRYGLWDQVFDRVHVDYTVTDDAERTIADFRARYPQFRDTPVEQHLLKVTTAAH
jgi:hypothetical protein